MSPASLRDLQARRVQIALPSQHLFPFRATLNSFLQYSFKKNRTETDYCSLTIPLYSAQDTCSAVAGHSTVRSSRRDFNAILVDDRSLLACLTCTSLSMYRHTARVSFSLLICLQPQALSGAWRIFKLHTPSAAPLIAMWPGLAPCVQPPHPAAL